MNAQSIFNQMVLKNDTVAASRLLIDAKKEGLLLSVPSDFKPLKEFSDYRDGVVLLFEDAEYNWLVTNTSIFNNSPFTIRSSYIETVICKRIFTPDCMYNGYAAMTFNSETELLTRTNEQP